MGEDHETTEIIMLDIDGARAWFEAHGIVYTRRQVQRMASEKKLPFKKGPNNRDLYISEEALTACLEKMR